MKSKINTGNIETNNIIKRRGLEANVLVNARGGYETFYVK